MLIFHLLGIILSEEGFNNINFAKGNDLMFDTVLIDLDGTLTDSKPGIFNSVCYSLDRMGFDRPDEDILIRFIGPPLIESFRKYCGMDDAQASLALKYYREYYSEKGYLENSVYPGVFAMLSRLRDSGRTLAVATSKPEDYSLRICDFFGLSEYFDIICGASMDESRNDKPRVIAYALEKLACPDPRHTIMVGDRHHDIEGASLNALKAMGVLYGYGSKEELCAAGAAYIAKDPEEAANIIIDNRGE